MGSFHDTMDYGYDPTVEEPGSLTIPPRPTIPVPRQAFVNAEWLPPVGDQTTPSCFVWASTYGLATFAAAQAHGYSPTSPSQQASPGYTYVKVLKEAGAPSGKCQGGHMTACFSYLKDHGGTPSMAAAPVPIGCAQVWHDYATTTMQPDPTFTVGSWCKIDVTGAGLNFVRWLVMLGTPVAYGTSLYTDFPSYNGSPSPYIGNGKLARHPDGSLVGHAMMIVGYDDDQQALLVQNSFGANWGTAWNGSRGFVWIAYATFDKLAQGNGYFIVIDDPDAGAAKPFQR